MINEPTNLVKAIGVAEDRTVEETGGGDCWQVQHVTADCHARSSRWSRFGLEHSEGEVLYGEVRARVDLDERRQSHAGNGVVQQLKASREMKAVRGKQKKTEWGATKGKSVMR